MKDGLSSFSHWLENAGNGMHPWEFLEAEGPFLSFAQFSQLLPQPPPLDPLLPAPRLEVRTSHSPAPSTGPWLLADAARLGFPAGPRLEG